MGKENYIFSQMGEEEGDTSDKLSNQFQKLKAVVACRRYLLIYSLNTTIAQLQSFFLLVIIATSQEPGVHSGREQKYKSSQQ